MLNTMRGFHHRASRRLASKRGRYWNGTYLSCPVDEAMRDCKLFPILVYIARRRQTILTYVEIREIYKLCRRATMSPGILTKTQFWWEQDLSHWMDIVKDGFPEARVIHYIGV